MRSIIRPASVAAALLGAGLLLGTAAPSFAAGVPKTTHDNSGSISALAADHVAVGTQPAVYKLPFSERLYLPTPTSDGHVIAHWLTFAEWQGMDAPAPIVTVDIPGVTYYGFPWSDEIIVGNGEPYPAKTSQRQLEAAGGAEVVFAGVTYMKAPRGDMIVVKDEGVNGPIAFLSLDDWSRGGQITPNETELGDFVYRQPGTSNLYVWMQSNDGCGMTHHLTFSEWVKLGQPAPKATVAPWNKPCYAPR
ncbi:hypothetical protein JT358_03200 [Micrococcales bacterium 31B]|nr:hypothetical protein [Micrococcales bacterium 31B]